MPDLAAGSWCQRDPGDIGAGAPAREGSSRQARPARASRVLFQFGCAAFKRTAPPCPAPESRWWPPMTGAGHHHQCTAVPRAPVEQWNQRQPVRTTSREAMQLSRPPQAGCGARRRTRLARPHGPAAASAVARQAQDARREGRRVQAAQPCGAGTQCQRAGLGALWC